MGLGGAIGAFLVNNQPKTVKAVLGQFGPLFKGSKGNQYNLGDMKPFFEVVDAPGHCDGHLVFRYRQGERTALFSGDCLFSPGRVSMQAIPDCRLDRYAETVIAIARDDLDILLFGDDVRLGRYAYWIGDEGVKARLNLIDPYAAPNDAVILVYDYRRQLIQRTSNAPKLGTPAGTGSGERQGYQVEGQRRPDQVSTGDAEVGRQAARGLEH